MVKGSCLVYLSSWYWFYAASREKPCLNWQCYIKQHKYASSICCCFYYADTPKIMDQKTKRQCTLCFFFYEYFSFYSSAELSACTKEQYILFTFHEVCVSIVCSLSPKRLKFIMSLRKTIKWILFLYFYPHSLHYFSWWVT